jgi:hypothetical protein
MSYEGTDYCICENGHVTAVDAYYSDCYNTGPKESRTNCPICKATMVDYIAVDQTNGDDSADAYFEEVAPAKTAVCNFGHTHELEAARYRIIKVGKYGRFGFTYLDPIYSPEEIEIFKADNVDITNLITERTPTS